MQEALTLSLGGYSHKMKVLLERVVKHLATFAVTLGQSENGAHVREVAAALGHFIAFILWLEWASLF